MNLFQINLTFKVILNNKQTHSVFHLKNGLFDFCHEQLDLGGEGIGDWQETVRKGRLEFSWNNFPQIFIHTCTLKRRLE